MTGAGRSGRSGSAAIRAGSGRAADGGGSRARGIGNRQRRALVVLPILLVFYAVSVHAVDSGSSRIGGFFAAVGLGTAVMLLRPVLVLAVMRCLGAQPVYLRFGLGPFVGFRATPTRVLAFRAIPLTLGGVYLPRARTYGRDLRVMCAALVLSPLVLNTLAAFLLLPPYARVIGVLLGLTYSTADAVSRPAGSARTLGARAFRKAPAEADRQLGDPEWGYFANALVASQFGDLEAAAAQLARLREHGHPAAELLEAALHHARGDYASAIRACVRLTADKPQPDPTRAALRQPLLGGLAFTILLVAERDPAAEARAVVLADQALDRRGRLARGRDVIAALALRALIDGAPERALHLAKRQLMLSATPLDLADALCTRARAQAALGRTADAHATLGRAAAVAPWYPRVAVVQVKLGAQLAAAVDLPAVDFAGEARLFEDPWSTSA